MTTENLRRDARLEARVPVAVIRGREARTHETADISFRGLFVETNDPLPVRSLARLRLVLPSRPIEAHAMVVHVAPARRGRAAGMGLSFWALSGAERRLWETFVRDLMGGHPANGETSSGIHSLVIDLPTPVRVRARSR